MNKLPFLGLAIMLLGSCSKSDLQTYDCQDTLITYTDDIAPIMASNCSISGCHNATAKAHGIDLSSYSSVVSESTRSRFLGAIQHLPGYDAMPEGRAKLDDSDIQTISCWIEGGKAE
mgnify:CR=1 FL=1